MSMQPLYLAMILTPKFASPFKIRDHGPGVAPRLLTEIFKPFHRTSAEGDANTQGAGLGLAIAERVVRRHDGTIRAYNASDGGLIVEIVLPIVPEARP